MDTVEASAPRLTRREFLGGAAGLTFAVALGPKGFYLVSPAYAAAREQSIGAWVRITPDNLITIITPAAEMGQGSMTGVPIALAEELDADWSKVTLEMAPAEADVYGYGSQGGRKSMGIYGSRAVMMYFDQMRLAGAQARKVLLDAAAGKLGVSPAELTTEPSAVVYQASGRRMSYGEIAAFAKVPARLPAVGKADLKPKSAFRLIGKPVPRHDIPPKVNGAAQYSIDVRLPGMVYASTVHSPVQLGQPVRWNDEAVRAMDGIVDVVPLEYGVAVVAGTFEQVLAARRALKVEWAEGARAQGYDSEGALMAGYDSIARDARAAAETVGDKGNVDRVFADAARVYKADFRSDYGYHAQMEPLNAVARFNADSGTLEVWEGSQAPDASRRRLAQVLGIGVDKVIHHQQYLGGGFGRRSINDYTLEAALVARATGRPVKMIWTREEDLAFGMFRPQALQCVEAALDGEGKVAGWRHCVVGDGGRLLYSGIRLDEYYAFPNQRVELRGTSHGIRLKHWRAVAHPFNVFAIEGLVDEMAAREGLDPLSFRRERMPLTMKARRLFDTVERMCDWHGPRTGRWACR